MSSGEDDLIARYFRPLASAPGALGLIDDAAVLTHSADDLVVTTDAIVEGVHFLANDPPDTLARKALRVNLSDLAAKGAEPAGFMLTLALRQASEQWLAPFAAALGEDAATFACSLFGGDTVSTSGPLMISVTAFGRVPPGRMVRRDAAKPGELVAVTGTIGDAALGLKLLQGKIAGDLDATSREFLSHRYRVPQPRNALALAVRDHASAAMDVSDGLAGDLAKLCAASKVTADVRIEDVPLSAAAHAVVARGQARRETLIAGGDDYEVLCTVPENHWAAFSTAAQAAGVPVMVIGRTGAGSAPPRFLDAAGRPIALSRLSYSHF